MSFTIGFSLQFKVSCLSILIGGPAKRDLKCMLNVDVRHIAL